MRFQLDHDWQGNMSTPRARVGDSAKTYLLLALCATWIFLGLFGHEPWKPLESTGISIVKTILDGGSLIAPLASGDKVLDAPPLYYLTASASAKLLTPLLPMHDGARLINAVWLTIILLMVGMSGRELWTRGVGRHAAFIMIGTIGLVTSAHSLTTEVASLASTATGFYALALSKRRPWRASALLGLALAVAFLTDGLLPLVILMSSALMLPLLFNAWRTHSFLKVLCVALLIASPLIGTWLFLLHYFYPSILLRWWHIHLSGFNQLNHQYFLSILIWYAWPAFPLAVLGLWRHRLQLLSKPKFQLMLVFFSCSLLFLGIGAAPKDINALPLLIPLVTLAAGSVEHLKRGAAAALNWFGVILFGLIGGLIWLGWFAMLTGHPAKIKERMQFLSGLEETYFSWFMFFIAAAITIVWLLVSLRAKQTNKSTVTNWALGMTFGWGLLMTLWLPMIDSAKSYALVFSSMHKSIPANYNCINSLHVSQPQRLLLNYYTNVQLKPVKTIRKLRCDLFLIQDVRNTAKIQAGQEWQLIWHGKRPADRKEGFRLFKIQH